MEQTAEGDLGMMRGEGDLQKEEGDM